MESQNSNKERILKRIHQNLKSIHHFVHDIPLPSNTEIYEYNSKFINSSKKSKLKHKFDRFTYYKDLKTEEIVKILFINDEKYINQGKFPFTDPLGNVENFSDLNVKRLKTTEAAYIGHLGNQLIIKKLEGVKLGENGNDFQTVDEKFEMIKIGNQQRFNQFLKLMSLNPTSMSMTIRIIIEESEGKDPQVIDYEFFHRQKQLIKKHSTPISNSQKNNS